MDINSAIEARELHESIVEFDVNYNINDKDGEWMLAELASNPYYEGFHSTVRLAHRARKGFVVIQGGRQPLRAA